MQRSSPGTPHRQPIDSQRRASPVLRGRGWSAVHGLFVAVAVAGCAPKVPRIPGPLDHLGRPPVIVARVDPRPVEPAPARAVPDDFASRVTDAAEHYLDHAPKGFRDDCSGYVMAVFARAGLPIDGNTASLYDWAREQGYVHHRHYPRPGDLAFFDDTYDRNDNGRLDDDLSHIAVVLDVEPDGTIVLAQAGTSRGRTTMRMNLEEPDVHEDDAGNVLNDWLRVKRDSDPGRTEYLSGELWKAFATLDPDALGDDRTASATGR